MSVVADPFGDGIPALRGVDALPLVPVMELEIVALLIDQTHRDQVTHQGADPIRARVQEERQPRHRRQHAARTVELCRE
jgi:hypothetical protein